MGYMGNTFSARAYSSEKTYVQSKTITDDVQISKREISTSIENQSRKRSENVSKK